MILQIHIWANIITIACMLIAAFTKSKPFQMISRVGYLVILGSGIWMIIDWHKWDDILFLTKSFLGLLVISAMEMLLIWQSKGKPTKNLWIAFIVVAIATTLLGMYLAGDLF